MQSAALAALNRLRDMIGLPWLALLGQPRHRCTAVTQEITGINTRTHVHRGTASSRERQRQPEERALLALLRLAAWRRGWRHTEACEAAGRLDSSPWEFRVEPATAAAGGAWAAGGRRHGSAELAAWSDGGALMELVAHKNSEGKGGTVSK